MVGSYLSGPEFSPVIRSPILMSATNFLIETLIFPGVFPRGLPRSTQSPNDRIDIVVNKYSPRNNLDPDIGDVSLILLHANGFHKVLPKDLELMSGII